MNINRFKTMEEKYAYHYGYISGMRNRQKVDEKKRVIERRVLKRNESFSESIEEPMLKLIDTIPNRYEGSIMKLRWGINTGELLSLEETGRRFGVTRERIRQIEHRLFLFLKRKDKTSLRDKIQKVTTKDKILFCHIMLLSNLKPDDKG